jgi:hypothetical protein
VVFTQNLLLKRKLTAHAVTNVDKEKIFLAMWRMKRSHSSESSQSRSLHALPIKFAQAIAVPALQGK